MSWPDQLYAVPSSSNSNVTTNDLRTGFDSEIELLFSEVNTLSKELRQGHRLPGTMEELLPAELNLLQVLARNGPRTVPQIARTRGTSRQNIQIMVNRLEKVGWVESIPNAAHKRSLLVVITPPGRDRLLAATSREQMILKGLSKHVLPSEVREATRFLHRLKALITQKQPPAEIIRMPSHSRTKSQPKFNPSNVDENVTENELPVNLL
jgi:DNA-binding MarR family transcriptional regulator